MKIAVIGAGAIGSLVAGYLAKAKEDILLVGRPLQVQALNTNGLRIQGVRGQECLPLRSAPQIDGKCDLAIFTVKTQDLENAVKENQSFLDKKTLIMTTQNGVQADRILSRHFEEDQMISSIVMFGATYIRPAEVVFNFEGDWIMGRPQAANDARLEGVAEVLKKAFPVVVSEDITGMKWLKLFVNFNNCLPALVGTPMQETFADLDFCRLSVLLLKEGLDIVQKAGIRMVSLPRFPVERILGLAAMPLDQAAGIIQQTLTKLSREPLYGSILQSIMRQKTSEIDYINGEVVRVAEEINLPAPLNRKVVELVHQVEREGHFFSPEEIKGEFSQDE